jgi:hypothetical protein
LNKSAKDGNSLAPNDSSKYPQHLTSFIIGACPNFKSPVS